MVQLSATRWSCIAILWVSLVTLCVASQWVFVVYFVIDSVQKLLDTPSYSHLLHVLHVLSVQSSWFNHPNNIWQNVHVMQLLILQWSPTSHHFLLLRSGHTTSTLFSYTLNLGSFLSMRDKVPYPYKTTGKI